MFRKCKCRRVCLGGKKKKRRKKNDTDTFRNFGKGQADLHQFAKGQRDLQVPLPPATRSVSVAPALHPPRFSLRAEQDPGSFMAPVFLVLWGGRNAGVGGQPRLLPLKPRLKGARLSPGRGSRATSEKWAEREREICALGGHLGIPCPEGWAAGAGPSQPKSRDLPPQAGTWWPADPRSRRGGWISPRRAGHPPRLGEEKRRICGPFVWLPLGTGGPSWEASSPNNNLVGKAGEEGAAGPKEQSHCGLQPALAPSN